MLRTTFPVDFTGVRLIFVGIVAILGFDSTSSAFVGLVAAGVPSVVMSPVNAEVVAAKVDGLRVGVLNVVGTIVVFTVVDGSQ